MNKKALVFNKNFEDEHYNMSVVEQVMIKFCLYNKEDVDVLVDEYNKTRVQEEIIKENAMNLEITLSIKQR